jgi:pyridoxal phosphate enzyme (YggS family)
VAAVREQVAAACRRAGRSPDGVTIIAVTKTRGVEEIRAVVEAGIRDLGENRVQELREKVSQVGPGVVWHLIGTLQSNKVKQALELAHLIHSLDRWSLAEELHKHALRRDRPVPALVQVNTSLEATKHGIPPGEVEAFVEGVSRLGGIQVLGLMTMAAPTEHPETARPCFRQLHGIFVRLASRRLPGVEMRYLSMGMSGDYPVAVEEGANLVRIGTALFGPRPHGTVHG